jgi:hypothetical protein
MNVLLAGGSQCSSTFINTVIDLTNDGTTNRSDYPISLGTCGRATFLGVSFVNPSYRTGAIFSVASCNASLVSGVDASGFQSGCEILDAAFSPGEHIASNIKTAGTFTALTTAAPRTGGRITAINFGSDNAPTFLAVRDYYGAVNSSTSIYRSGGAEIDATAFSWGMVSGTVCSEAAPLYTPWIYGSIASTGSKTFTLYVSQNGGSGDLTDAEIWMEVEYLGTSSSPMYSLGSDQRSNSTNAFVSVTEAPDAQADDTTSSWTGITATYKQVLAVTGTVNDAGLYRARVALGKVSTTVYVDPKVTVT